MSSTGCEPMTAALTSLLARPDVASTLRRLVEAHASIEEQIDAVIAFADPGVAAGAAKNFELHSLRPSTPLEFARHKRVRITIDSEEDVVRVALSHVPGRHAEWYAPAR